MDKQLIEELFGTESAFGIRYVDEQNNVYTPEELDIAQANGTSHGSVDSSFPDNLDAVRCTNYAIQIGKKFRRTTQIFGFENVNNPDCEFAQQRLHPGGHDFAIVEERWLIDPWVRLVRGAYQEIVYDLQDPVDAALVTKRYGKRENWKRMTRVEHEFKPIRISSRS